MQLVDPQYSLLRAVLALPPPRLQLADLPTPVERAPWADQIDREIWIKRDDKSSVLYGGGKVRKLEWLLADPRVLQAPWVVSAGATGSHHLLAMALFLRDLGRPMAAFVFPQPATDHVRANFAALVSLGVAVWPMRSRIALPFCWLARAMLPRTYAGWHYVDAGASSGRGCLGFVEAGFELAAQISRHELPQPDQIMLATGTAGSAAGLAIGLALAGIATTVVAVATVEPWFFNHWLLQRKVQQVWHELRQFGLSPDVAQTEVMQFLQARGVHLQIAKQQVGAGYGAPTPAGQAAVEQAGQYGLVLEPTYTAKAFAEVQTVQLRKPRERRQIVLYWHTHSGADLSCHVVSGWRERAPAVLLRSLEKSLG